MSNTAFIEPDIGFIKELKQNGGEELSKCYQCATCTVACNLTPLDRPFPRREMVLAQWGSADKLIYNSDVWLCHNCGDCSDKCPRGANPAETLAAIRNVSYQRLTIIPFLGKIFSTPKHLITMYLVPVVIFLGTLYGNDRLGIPDTWSNRIVYSEMFSLKMIDAVILPTVGIVGILSLLQIFFFWKGMKKHEPPLQPVTIGSIIGGLISTLIAIMTHKQFVKCDVNKPRFGAHGMMFYGFIALFITTNLVMLYSYGW
ncbi:MAG: 4Fe-4S dicluster domain-containing protein, partial [Spirochaetia bacterium]|nr:4Fe-4S dicluster domain-containing protein [Spirochaetia bacterium]